MLVILPTSPPIYPSYPIPLHIKLGHNTIMYLKRVMSVFIIFFTVQTVWADHYACLLDNQYMENLFVEAENYFECKDISVVKDIRGFILRVDLKSPEANFCRIQGEVYYKIKEIELFLAKIKNPVIIEVHTKNIPENDRGNLKNWEFSTVIANNVEDVFCKEIPELDNKRFVSAGYGEFMPADKNTSNNGSNYADRIDIIILCSKNGE